MSEFEFDLEPKKTTVVIGGKRYELREADTETSIRYQNFMMQCTKFEGGQPVAVIGLASAKPEVVSACLYDENGDRVPVEVVNSWPARITNKLFDWVQENSDLMESPEGKKTGN